MGRLVVIDTETTGLVAGDADLIQLAAIVLTPEYDIDKQLPPFKMLIKPKRYENTKVYFEKIAPAMNVNGLDIDNIMKIGFDAYKAAELFDEWWKTLGSQPLETLGQNWPFDKAFLIDWLGGESFNQMFSRYYRDTYAASNYIRDKAKWFKRPDPFPNGQSLPKLAKALNVQVERSHDAWFDCITTAECYKRMLYYEPAIS